MRLDISQYQWHYRCNKFGKNDPGVGLTSYQKEKILTEQRPNKLKVYKYEDDSKHLIVRIMRVVHGLNHHSPTKQMRV